MTFGRRQLDWIIAGLLLAVAVVYQTLWPRDLNGADESYFLFEAKRLLDGDVMYRDIFQFITPGAFYVMTLLYRLFGVDLATARTAMAVLHGATAVFTYAAARRMRVRPAVAVVAAAVYLGVSQPVYAIASPHWCSTLLVMWLLFRLLRDDWAERSRAAFTIGLLCGTLVMVQQQKGVVTGIGIAALLVVDRLCAGRYGVAADAAGLFRRLSVLAAGVLVVTVPCLLALLALSGFAPMYDALVRFPLSSYGPAHYISFGGRGFFTDAPFEWIVWSLAHMPWLLVPPAGRAVWLLVRRRDQPGQRRRTVLVMCGLTAIASILYYPDFIHLAFISPVFLVAAADSVEWALAVFGARQRLANAVAAATAVVVLAMLGVHMRDHLQLRRAQFPFSLDTAFGRVDYRTEADRTLSETLRTMVAAQPSPILFAYPATVEPYLTAGARNPTRFQILMLRVNPPAHFDEVLAVLERERVPLVAMAPLAVKGHDPIRRYVDAHYDFVDIGQLPSIWLYRRRADPPTPDGAG